MVISYTTLASVYKGMRTRKRRAVGQEPRFVTTWVFSIALPPPTTDIPKGHIFRLSQNVLMFDHDAFLTREVLPNPESDVFDMISCQVDLRIQGVVANPGKQIRIHEAKVRNGEEVGFGFGLGDDSAIDIIKVESHHIFLGKI